MTVKYLTTPSPLGEPLVTAADVAAFLGVHVASVYRMAGRADGIPVVEIGAGVRRFRQADVREYVDRRTRGCKSLPGRSARILRQPQTVLPKGLATPPNQSVTPKQESSAGSKRRKPEART